MENNLRPRSLGDVAGQQSLNQGTSSITERANRLRGLTSSDAQTNNTDNFSNVSIDSLREFKNHPFKVIEDEELHEFAESIKESGVIEPIIVRRIGNGEYEILAGHRRFAAAKLNGLTHIPAKIYNVSDEEATIIMTNTNLKSRQKILHSEKAKAYKMQIEAYKCQGKRNDLINFVRENIDLCSNGTQVDCESINDLCSNGTQVKSRDIIAQKNNTSPLQITRYLRLNELIESLLELVDKDEIPFRAGVALSFLSEDEQQMVFNGIEEGIIKKIDLPSAEELKGLSKAGQLNQTEIRNIFKKEIKKVTTPYNSLRKATSKALKSLKNVDYSNIKIEEDELEKVIIEAIKRYTERQI
ncbi:MAG: ParB/RepB/Spo0J family partition protein [Aminipila sp.]